MAFPDQSNFDASAARPARGRRPDPGGRSPAKAGLPFCAAPEIFGGCEFP
jgi:hypothetical protein